MSNAILDDPNVLQVLFHPRPDDSYHGPASLLVGVEVEPGITVGGRLYPANPEAPAILYFHGNGEIAADYDMLAQLYTQRDITLLVMDFRGYGTSDGYPTASTLLTDARAICENVGTIFAEHNLSPRKLFVMGRSLGSVSATEIASQMGDQIDGLIIESGFSDTFGLLARLGVMVRGASEQEDGAGNAFKMQQVTVPTLVLHGKNDILIPASDGEELYRQCAATDKKLVLIPGAGHNDIMLVGMNQYFEEVRTLVHG